MTGRRPAWVATHQGKVRPSNEDCCAVANWQSSGPVSTWQGRVPCHGGWALVADGMGGHDAGDVASRIAVEASAELIGRTSSEADIHHMLMIVNSRLFEAMYSGEGRPGMGTTIVGVLLVGSEALVFNIGDSRAYSLQGERLQQLTHDDSLTGQSRRSGHAITQSLGGTTSRRPIHPHIEKVTLHRDATILLCSDGLTDMIADETILDILLRNKDQPAQGLLSAALDAGGRDNVTAVVIGHEVKHEDQRTT